MKEKTNNIKTTLGYNPGGITKIWLLNIDDFVAYQFKNDDLSNRFLVEKIIASSKFSELEAINESNFTESYSDGTYKQKLSTFIYPLTADNSQLLESVKAGKYLIAFRSVQKQYFCFGADGGASFSLSLQSGKTGDTQGYSITIEKTSTDSLFEIADINNIATQHKYRPVFEDGVFCQLKNGKQTGFQVAGFAVKTSLDGLAMDVEGNSCHESHLPQAIALLEGLKKPSGDFHVERYYDENTTQIGGCSIIKYNGEKCKPQSNNQIYTDRRHILFVDVDLNIQETIRLVSTSEWWLIPPDNDIANFSLNGGKAGIFEIVITRKEIDGNEHNEYYVFDNGKQQVRINVVVSEDFLEWVICSDDKGSAIWNKNGYWLEDYSWYQY